MIITTQDLINNLNHSINRLRFNIRGYVKLPADTTYSLILEYSNSDEKEDNLWIKSLSSTSVLGIHTTSISVHKSLVKLFPDGKNMNDMMNDPLEFHNWKLDNKITN